MFASPTASACGLLALLQFAGVAYAQAGHVSHVKIVSSGRNTYLSSAGVASNGAIRKRDATLSPIVPMPAVAILWPMKVGTQDFTVEFSTTTGNTWIVADDFECIAQNGSTTTKDVCAFADGFNGDFSGGIIDDVVFNASWPDGRFATGQAGKETISMLDGDAVFADQVIALVNRTRWTGTSEASGVVGWAYTAVTYFFNSSDAEVKVPEPSIIDTIRDKAGWLPIFSMVLKNDIIVVGGYPSELPTQSNYTATAEIVVWPPGETTRERRYYAVKVEGYHYGDQQGTDQQTTVLVDTESLFTLAPNYTAQDFNRRFQPPAVLDHGYYWVDCNATAPSFGITIRGANFDLEPNELILADPWNPDSGKCVSAIQNAGTGPATLGLSFLKSVVAVFDAGQQLMSFAPYENWVEAKSGKILPPGNGTNPAGNGTMPSGNGTMPSGNGTAPAGNGTAPAGNGTAPACKRRVRQRQLRKRLGKL